MAIGTGASSVPLTPLQRRILRLIAANRSEDSHFAGGLILNADDQSPRYSHDFDIFHDAEVEVARASDADLKVLREAGYEVDLSVGDWSQPASFRKARIEHEGEQLEIDWAVDSAFRFYPVERDPELGWRLHLFDIATNKALALSARSMTRDYVDIVELHHTFPLPAIVWAACGKDPGFSPLFLLEMMKRFARINPRQLEAIQARDIDPVALKRAWIEMSDQAEIEITRIADVQPTLPIGVAFVDANGKPGWIGDDSARTIHRPSVRGCWPRIAGSGQ
jgi:hypothetical protein